MNDDVVLPLYKKHEKLLDEIKSEAVKKGTFKSETGHKSSSRREIKTKDFTVEFNGDYPDSTIKVFPITDGEEVANLLIKINYFLNIYDEDLLLRDENDEVVESVSKTIFFETCVENIYDC